MGPLWGAIGALWGYYVIIGLLLGYRAAMRLYGRYGAL